MIRMKNGGITLAFHSSGNLLVSTSWEGMLRVWDPWSGREVLATPASIHAWRSGLDGRLLLVEPKGSKLRLLEVTPGQEFRTLSPDAVDHNFTIFHSLDISPDGDLVAVSTENGLCFFSLKRNRMIDYLSLGETRGVFFEPGRVLRLWAWSTQMGTRRWPMTWANSRSDRLEFGPAEQTALPGTRDIALSMNGKLLVGIGDNDIAVLDRGLPGKTLKLAPTSQGWNVSIGRDNRYLAAGRDPHPGG